MTELRIREMTAIDVVTFHLEMMDGELRLIAERNGMRQNVYLVGIRLEGRYIPNSIVAKGN